MPISKFKATCLSALEQVRTYGRPLRVTRLGRPVVDIVPPRDVGTASWLGAMAGTATITGDLRDPIVLRPSVRAGFVCHSRASTRLKG
jgi:antitoxin (DNA-binding transcriptional repressor) of toxin-antitoxin stability system